MNADDVRALVAAKWPNATSSPLATAFAAAAAQEAAERAIGFAKLQSKVSEANKSA